MTDHSVVRPVFLAAMIFVLSASSVLACLYATAAATLGIRWDGSQSVFESTGQAVCYNFLMQTTLGQMTNDHWVSNESLGGVTAAQIKETLEVAIWNKSLNDVAGPQQCYRAQTDAMSWHGLPPEVVQRGAGTGQECATPLVLDLDGSGFGTTSLDASPVLFELNENKAIDITGWTDPSYNNGFLYRDLNGDAELNGAFELFGNRTRMPDGTLARNGFEALAPLDQIEQGGNEDGRISIADRAWYSLGLWIDHNHDGRMGRNEGYSLADWRIEEISLEYREIGPEEEFGVDQAGNFHVFQGSFAQRANASSLEPIVRRSLHDIIFRSSVY